MPNDDTSSNNNPFSAIIVPNTGQTTSNDHPLKVVVVGGGDGGSGGQVNTIVAGDNITVDDSDPVNPIISATVSGGGGGGLSSPLTTDTDFDLANHSLKFISTNPSARFETQIEGGEGIVNSTLYGSGIVMRTGGVNGGEGVDYKGNFTLNSENAIVSVPNATIELNGGSLSTISITVEDLMFYSSNITANSQLYVNGVNQVRSALISGASGSRPGSPITGQQFFDTSLTKPIWWSGSDWVDATGTTV